MKYFFVEDRNHDYANNLLKKARSLWNKNQLTKNELIGPTSVYRMVFGENANGKERLIKNIVLDSLISCEIKVPGSSIYFSELLSDINEVVGTGRLSTNEIKEEILKISTKEKSKLIYESAVDISGPETQIVVKKNPRSKTIIEVSTGFKMPIGMDPLFHKNIPEDLIDLTDIRVVLIEGTPSSIGEINYLLERSHNEKENILLICRSFSEEIIATLSTNWIRNSLRIIPAIYGNDIENINLPADICEIVGGIPISPSLGDSISSAITKNEKYGYAKSIKIDNFSCTLQSDKSVDVYRNSLINRMNLEQEKEKQDILSDRISSLSSELITILIPDKDDILFEEIDAMFKIHSQFCQSGYVQCSKKKIPMSIWKNVIEHKISYTKLLNSIGGYLLIDD